MSIAQGPYVGHIIKDGGNWEYQVRTRVSPDSPKPLGSHIATVNAWACPGRDATDTMNMLAAAPAMLSWLEKAKQMAEQQARGGDDIPLQSAWQWLADNITQILPQ